MKFLKFFIIIFISLTTSIKADLNEKLLNQLKEGGKLIFIRHAYAPGSGDPANFNLDDCSSQRNLNLEGKKQAEKIGEFFRKNNINIYQVFSSEWCRCKDTAQIAFYKFKTKNFLNSFYDERFSENKDKQILGFQKFIKNWNYSGNLALVTHYVVISEILDLATSSGEIVITDNNLEILSSIKIN